jgi:membrane peptidoglycan carboxypeptidase
MPYSVPVAWVASLGEGGRLASVTEFAARARLPSHLVHLVLLVEDKRFWIHSGTDPLAVLRAAYMNLRKRGRKQGGSTIPEQLVKMKSDRNDRTLAGRAGRSLSAIQMVAKTSRRDLLDEYLRKVYLGRDVHGVREGAQFYFSKDPMELTIGESFFLAERIALPNIVRAGRIRNLLQRAQVQSIVCSEFHRLPSIYGACFSDGAEDTIERVVNELSRGYAC